MKGTWLVKAALKRPVTVSMLTIASLVLSLFSYGALPMELIPSGFTPPFLFVRVQTLYSAPQEIEADVVLPVEEELGFVRNVDTLRTEANRDSATFLLRFTDGTDMDVAYNEVRDHVMRGIKDSSSVIGQPFIWKYNPEDEPVMWFGLTAPEQHPRPEIPVRETLVPTLEQIPGVSRVQLYGVPEPEVLVNVDMNRAQLVPGGMLRIIERIAEDNLSMALGTVRGGGAVLPLRFVASIDTMSTIRDLPIVAGVQLSDVADISIDDARGNTLYRINGKPGMFVGVYREPSANLVKVGREIREALSSLGETSLALDGFDTHIFFDQSALIEGTIGELQRTAIWGAIFAFLVLFLFLKNWRITLIVAIAIPLSLLLTIAALYLTSATLNVLSLTGMMLSAGLVVDNSIVVAESIQRYLVEGYRRVDAAVEGTAEVMLAVVVATMTSVVVFLPIVLMSGSEMLTFYLKKIGFPVCAALLASLVTSCVLVPLLTVWMAPREAPGEGRVMRWLARQYQRTLNIALTRKGDAVIIMLIVCSSIIIPIKNVPTSDRMKANINDIRLRLDFESSMTWDEKVAALGVYEQKVLDKANDLEIRDVRVGLGDVGIGGTELRVFLKAPEQRELTREEVVQRFHDILPSVPGVKAQVSWSGFGGGRDSSYRITLVGPDSRTLRGISKDVISVLSDIEGVQSVVPAEQSNEEMELIFTPLMKQLSQMEISSQAIAMTLDYALRGRQLSTLGHGRTRLPIVVRAAAKGAGAREHLSSMKVAGSEEVAIGDVTTQKIRPALREIERQNRETTLSLVIQSTRDDLETLSNEVDDALADIPFPRGYGVEKSGRFKFLERGSESRMVALWLAILFVFVLMAVLFESLLIPFAVLWSVPFAALGVYWTVYITDGAIDVMVAVGLLILVGIVVNNAIVLVDLVRELEKRRGYDRRQALLEGGARRLRPILMTAATTIIGMTPMALSRTTLVGIPYAPLGRAVIGGLVVSTVVTLFVVPVFYAVLQSLSERLRR